MATSLTVLGIRFSSPNPKEPAVSNRPAQIYVAPKRARLTEARSRAVAHVAHDFFFKAVLRNDPGAAWVLAAPSLRESLTRVQWKTGAIPVVPYPAKAFGSAVWTVSYSYVARVGLEIAVRPKSRSGVRAALFTMELQAFGKGQRRRWLVSSWVPAGAAVPRPPLNVSGSVPPPKRLSAIWLIVPASVLALALLVPISIFVREGLRWARNARASIPS